MQNFENEMEHEQQMPCQIPPFSAPSTHPFQTLSQTYNPSSGLQATFVSSLIPHAAYEINEATTNSYHPIAPASFPLHANSQRNDCHWANNGDLQTPDGEMHYPMQQMRSPRGSALPNGVSVPSVSQARQYNPFPWQTNGLMHNGHYGNSAPLQSLQLDPTFHYQPPLDYAPSRPSPSLDYFSPSTNNTFGGLILNLPNTQTNNNNADFIPLNYIAPETLTDTPSNAPSPHATTVSSGRSSPSLVANFVEASFPLGTEDYQRLQEKLREVMQSDWISQKKLEPNKERYRLYQFLSRNETNKRFSCLFWEGSSRCRYTSKKSQHALTHVRKHLKHRPYVCGPLCPFYGSPCSKRYYTLGVLKQHQKGKVKCKPCGKFMCASNIKRHQDTACKKRPMA